MADLRGTLVGTRGETSRLGSKNHPLVSRLATWTGEVQTVLRADGSFTVTIRPINGTDRITIDGNADTATLGLIVKNGQEVSTG